MAEPHEQGGGGPAYEAVAPLSPLPRGLRLRLTVAIPLVVSFLVMLGGFLALWVSDPLFFQTTRPTSVEAVERRVVGAFLTVGAFTLVSLLVALALAASIARPLKTLATRMETLRRARGEPPQRPGPRTEIDALGSAFQGVVSSVSTFIHDSHTLQSLEGGVLTADRSGVVTSFNAAAEKILGLAASDVVGRPLTDALPDEPANAAFLGSLRAAQAGARRLSSAEAAVRTGSGRAVQLGYTLSPLRDETRRSLGVVLTFKDLAERKAAEELMQRAERLAVLGSLAAGLAHQLRTPLGATRGLVELLREDCPEGSSQRTYAEKALASIDRMTRLTRDLLTISNPEPRRVEPMNVNDVVRATVDLCQYDLTERPVEIQERYAAGLPSVPGDAEHLHQAIGNLVRNAVEATGAGGRVTIETRRDGGRVAVAIHNTGSYITPEQHKKLFTPFVTGKRKGTGLGLVIAHQIVRAHGGRIGVTSDPAQGTTFTVELPLAAPGAAATPPPHASGESSERVGDLPSCAGSR